MLPAPWFLLIAPSRRMRDTRTPESVKLRSQPQPASMATSPQYYRSANNHAHYQNFPPNNNDHLYTLWQQDSNHPPYNGPPPAPFLHYSQGGAASVAHSNSTSHDWSSGYARQSNQAWSQSVDSGSYAARSAIPYDAVGGAASVLHQPHENPRPDYHDEPPSNRHELPLSPQANAYRDSDGFSDVRTTVGVHKV